MELFCYCGASVGLVRCALGRLLGFNKAPEPKGFLQSLLSPHSVLSGTRLNLRLGMAFLAAGALLTVNRLL